MSTVHSEEIKPDSMAGGFNRLIIIAALGVLACLVFYGLAKPLKNSKNTHRNEVSMNVSQQVFKA